METAFDACGSSPTAQTCPRHCSQLTSRTNTGRAPSRRETACAPRAAIPGFPLTGPVFPGASGREGPGTHSCKSRAQVNIGPGSPFVPSASSVPSSYAASLSQLTPRPSDSEGLADQDPFLLPRRPAPRRSWGSGQNRRRLPSSQPDTESLTLLTSTTEANTTPWGSDLAHDPEGQGDDPEGRAEPPASQCDPGQETCTAFPSRGRLRGTDSLNGLAELIPCDSEQGPRHRDQVSPSRAQCGTARPALPRRRPRSWPVTRPLQVPTAGCCGVFNVSGASAPGATASSSAARSASAPQPATADDAARAHRSPVPAAPEQTPCRTPRAPALRQAGGQRHE